MRERDQRRLVDALDFALAAHAGQTRKGVDVPYASHLLQVAGLVLECGGDVTQSVAALLHDTLEDCEGVDATSLRKRFGDEVAEIVADCSDLLPGDGPSSKSSWRDRKTRYIERVATADPRSRLVAACDKLHNLRSLVGDLRADGPATLERFHAAPPRIRWYYESAQRALADALPVAARGEFERLIRALAEHIPDSEAP